MKDNIPMLTQTQQREAPWNQEELEPIKMDCSVCYCISKSMPVRIENYSINDEENCFDDTNFIQEFTQDSNAFGIPNLLKELEILIDEKISRLKLEKDWDSFRNRGHGSRQIDERIKYYKGLLKAAKGWVVDDLDVEIDE